MKIIMPPGQRYPIRKRSGKTDKTKGHLPPCERCPFIMQKVAFRRPKSHLLEMRRIFPDSLQVCQQNAEKHDILLNRSLFTLSLLSD